MSRIEINLLRVDIRSSFLEGENIYLDSLLRTCENVFLVSWSAIPLCCFVSILHRGLNF